MMFAAAFVLAVFAAGAQELRPSRDFLAAELQALQDDPSRHPGWLWVDEGEALWRNAPANGKRSCASCHGDIAKTQGIATRYPVVEADGTILDLEARIERCRVTHQQEPEFGRESEALLSLVTAIGARSRGMPMVVASHGPAAEALKEGAQLYTRRQGQLNLSCAQCHNNNVGRKLRGDTISHGLATGYPAYRLEWNTLGSLHRRLSACQLGVRAVRHPPGSRDYLALSLYLAHRARGLPVEVPGVRR
ncbi:MAG: sulfur oxidation c-type cytochrome SoxA [Bosea sp. (in: a-proteobacteria)]